MTDIILRLGSWPHFHHLLEAFPQRGSQPSSFWMGEGFIEAHSCERGVNLTGIFVLPSKRRQGLGTQYMREFLAVIDKHGGECFIYIKPFGYNQGMTERGLRAWYARLGFIPRPGRAPEYMYRPAHRLELAA